MRAWLFLASVVACHELILPPAPGARLCSADVDCRVDEHCAFSGVDTRATCQPGGRDPIDVPSLMMRKPEAGADDGH